MFLECSIFIVFNCSMFHISDIHNFLMRVCVWDGYDHECVCYKRDVICTNEILYSPVNLPMLLILN